MSHQDFSKIVEECKGIMGAIETKHEEQKSQLEEHGKVLNETKENTEKAVAELETKITALEKLGARMQQSSQPVIEEKALEMVNKTLKLNNKEKISMETVAEVKSAFEKYITKGEKLLSPEEFKALNTVSDPNGGYLVIPQVATALVDKKFDKHGLMDVVERRTTGGQYEVIVDWDDYDEGFFNNELNLDTTANISGTADYGKVTFNNNDIIYEKKFTRKMLEDPFINVETDVVAKMDKGIDRKIGNLLVNGTGVNEPKGLLTYTAGTTFGTIQQVTSGTSATLKWADVLSLLPAELKDDYHANANYLMRRASFFGLLAEASTTGELQLNNMINFFSGQGVEMNILGYGVKFEAGMPAVASNALAVAFGDFSGYIYTETPAVAIGRDDTKPTYVNIWKRRRADGKVVDFDSVKLLKIKS